jgi:lysophospholipase L1-like esterase
MFEWVNKDDNAVFVPLFSKFGQGLFNLTPNVVTSSDGVHLTHNGVVILDNLFDKAKSAKPKSIID